MKEMPSLDAQGDPGRPYISVVIPVYNEAECVGPQIEALYTVLPGLGRPFEIVMVDDGSTDRTPEILKAEKARRRELRVVRLLENRGQSAASAAGFAAMRGEVAFVLDGDLQSDPADIPPMLERLERGDCDAVCGWRTKREDNWLRRASSRIANGVRNWVSGDQVTDTGCPIKLFRAGFLRRIPVFKGMHRFLPTLVKFEGARVVELPVRHRPRLAGRSKYGLWNRAFKSAADLLAVRWLKSRHVHYRAEEID